MNKLVSIETGKRDILNAMNAFVALLKINTGRAYQRDIEDYLAGVETLTLKDTIVYFQLLHSQGYSKSSIDRKKAALSKFFQFLYENEFASSNPFTTQTFKMMMKKIAQDSEISETKLSNKPDAHHLKWDEIERILSLCGPDLEGQRNKVIILLGVYEGLRRSEIVNLKWSDIQEEINGRALLIRAAKGGSGKIDLHPRVYEALQDLREMYSLNNLDTDYVIVSLSNNNHGERLTTKSVNRIVKSLAKKAGIKNSDEITAHDLRHTCAIQLLAHGASVEKVSRHLRHKNIQTTMTYLKTLELHENSAVTCLP